MAEVEDEIQRHTLSLDVYYSDTLDIWNVPFFFQYILTGISPERVFTLVNTNVTAGVQYFHIEDDSRTAEVWQKISSLHGCWLWWATISLVYDEENGSNLVVKSGVDSL